jgi:hypothetical protein
MRKTLITSVLAAAIFAFAPAPEADGRKLSPAFSQARSDTSTAIKIGLVDNGKYQYLDGCGYAFWLADKAPKFRDPGTQKYLLVGNYDKKGWMNIDDQIVELQLTENTLKYQGRKGDRYHQIYKSDDIRVNVECVATGFGDTHAVDCDATITVVKGAKKQVVKAVGSGGC